jgi:hypothetical protein
MGKILAAGIVSFLLLAVLTASGKTDQKFYAGECNGGNVSNWWCVITFENGVPVRMTGMNCRGQMYYNIPIGSKVVQANPILGMTVTATGTDDDGRIWRAVIHYDAANQPDWMGGVTGDGTNWVVDSFAYVFE